VRDQILRGEAHFYQGVLIQHQSYHGDYACSFGGVAMSRGNGMDFSTRVPAVRHAWATVIPGFYAKTSTQAKIQINHENH
jgi:hypothetical protein